MRNSYPFFPILLLILFSYGVFASSDTTGGENRIQAILEESISKNIGRKGGGLLSVSLFSRTHNQKCAASTFVSGKIAGSKSSAVQSDAPYGIASITKTFLATLALIYAQRKQLDLDTPIIGLLENKKWILDQVSNNEFKRNLKTVTFRQLLSHRAGFADYWENDQFFDTWKKDKQRYWSHLEILKWAGKMKPKCKVDRCFHYADTNYLIAGLVLERKFNKKLHMLFRKEIFDPLKMRCSWMYFEESKPSRCGPVAHSYERKLDVTKNRMQSADWASGGVYSTLEDQMKFFSVLFFTDRLLSEQSRMVMMNVRNTNWFRSYQYGLGIYSIKMGRDLTLIGHEGIHNAFSFLWKEYDILFTGSLNQERNQAVDELLYPIMRTLKEDGWTRWLKRYNQSC